MHHREVETSGLERDAAFRRRREWGASAPRRGVACAVTGGHQRQRPTRTLVFSDRLAPTARFRPFLTVSTKNASGRPQGLPCVLGSHKKEASRGGVASSLYLRVVVRRNAHIHAQRGRFRDVESSLAGS